MVGGATVLTTTDQNISGRKIFLGTIDFTGNSSLAGGINFNRTNYYISQYGQFLVKQGGGGMFTLFSASLDPYTAQTFNLTDASISMDWSQRALSGQWSCNAIPSWTGHLINLGYLQTGNFANSYSVNTSSNQTITGVKTFVNSVNTPSGITATNLSLFNPAYQDGDTIFETNSGNNISWSKGQLQNNSTVYLNWTGQQLSGNWSTNTIPTLPNHLINLEYVSGGAFIPALNLATLLNNQTFSGANRFINLNISGGAVHLNGNLTITESGSYASGGWNVFDPNSAQFTDFGYANSLNYNNRVLEGQWTIDTPPNYPADIVNLGYISGGSLIPLLNLPTLAANQTFSGTNTFSGINLINGNGITFANFIINQSGILYSGSFQLYNPNTAQFRNFGGNNTLNYDTSHLDGNWNMWGNSLYDIGHSVNYTTGNNAVLGTGRLVAGAQTISTTAVTSNALIFLQRSSQVNNTGNGYLVPSGISAGASFLVRSLTSSGTINVFDSGSFYWEIKNTVN